MKLLRSIAFNLAGTVFGGLAAYAIFFRPDASVWPLVVLAVASTAAANLDRIKELSASLTSFKLIRAEVAVDQLRRLVRQNAETQLALLQRSQRWSGFSEFTSWLSKKGHSHYLNFRSVGGQRHC